MSSRTRGLALAALALGLAACANPPLAGAPQSTRHYVVRADSDEPSLDRSVGASLDRSVGASLDRSVGASLDRSVGASLALRAGRLAERLHERLQSDFGAELDAGPIEVWICTQRETFDRLLGTTGQLDPSAIQGSCEPGKRIVVLWRDDPSGAQALAHELVHRFFETFEPDAPSWLEEGLARALALAPNGPAPAAGLPPHTDLAHPVVTKRMPDAEVWTRLDALAHEEFHKDSDFLENAQNHDVTDCCVAATVVRYGLETQGWKDLGSIGRWKPDKQAFLEWLKKATPELRFEHFAPLELSVDPAPPPREKNP